MNTADQIKRLYSLYDYDDDEEREEAARAVYHRFCADMQIGAADAVLRLIHGIKFALESAYTQGRTDERVEEPGQ